jgi:hypothetical protein
MAARSSVAATNRRHRWRGRVLLTVLALVLIWLVAGFSRAPSVASDYLVRTESPKRVSDVTTSLVPGIPPFWVVTVSGTITEATGTHYSSSQILWVEPLTGWVIVFAQG